LNWNTNPAIKEAAERLAIFENPPQTGDWINLDITQDFDRILQQAELNVNDPNSGVIFDISSASINQGLKVEKIFSSEPKNNVIDTDSSLEFDFSDGDLLSDIEYSNIQREQQLKIRIPNN
jgi:hypothetical protein